MREFCLLLAFAAVAGGCTGSATENADRTDIVIDAATDEPFRLRPGETARVGADGLLIAFRGVGADSRCPSDVTCVWSGDATVRVGLAVGREEWISAELHTHLEPRSAAHGGYTVRLLDLTPYPVSTSSIASREYVVTLDVTRGGS